MYSVPSNFHTAVQNGGRTRARIYLFDSTVDPTDDNDVQTNGTLLKMLPGDTDSNSRIEQSGIVFPDYFNREPNVKIGDTVSNQISFSIINLDGAFNGYNFQRCKIWLDVYHDQSSSWIPCPMGVYIFQTPEKTTGNVIYLTAFDMMQDLDQIADSWFNGLTWTNGITLSSLFAALASQCGKSSIADQNMVNGSLTFTEAPFVSTNRTYRDILSWIAEVSCSIAKFNRDGYLILRWFSAAQISGSTYSKNVDVLGCGVFGLTISEYSVDAITGLSVNSVGLSSPVLIGTNANAYTISGNPFIADAVSADVTTKATPILTKLSSLGSYTPIVMTSFIDWSIEAGDIINVTYKGTTYQLPIFQQDIMWAGGRVKSQLMSSGDKTIPKAEPKEERDEYRIEKQFTDRVTFTDLETGGSTVINGDNITTGEISANRIKGGTLTLGGADNGNGSVVILDENGNEIGTINKNAFTSKKYDSQHLQTCYATITRGGIYLDATGNNFANSLYVSIRVGSDGEGGQLPTHNYGLLIIGNENDSNVVNIQGRDGKVECFGVINRGAYASLSADEGLRLGATTLNQSQLQQLLALI